jgi:magnesium chelatase family protein
MNPCPCGHLGDVAARCRCTPERITSYRERLSGPLLDRIDLHVELPRVTPDEIARVPPSESSAAVAARVAIARERQVARPGRSNSRLDGPAGPAGAAADAEALALLATAMRRLSLSARAYHRVLRVARTIADLEGSPQVRTPHVAEAVTLRQLDRRAAATAVDTISI